MSRTGPTKCRPAPQSAAIAESGDGRFDRPRNGAEDPSTAHPCAVSKAHRSTLAEPRSNARHGHPPLPPLLIPLHKVPHAFPLKITQISHASGLPQLPPECKHLFFRYISETGLEPVINFPTDGAGSQFFSVREARGEAYRVSASDERKEMRKVGPSPRGLRRKSGHVLLSA